MSEHPTVWQEDYESKVRDLHQAKARIRTLEAQLAEYKEAVRVLGVAQSIFMEYSFYVPCPYCGPSTPNTVTDCEGCDGHGRAPHPRMQNEPEQVFKELEEAVAQVDANPIAKAAIEGSNHAQG